MAKFLTKRSFQNIQIWTRVLIMKVLEVLYSSVVISMRGSRGVGVRGSDPPFGKLKFIKFTHKIIENMPWKPPPLIYIS